MILVKNVGTIHVMQYKATSPFERPAEALQFSNKF